MWERGYAALLAPLAAACLLGTGCMGILPSKSANTLATLQFLDPAPGAECAILRAHGDHVVVVLLNDRPHLDEIPDFLTRRGLERVDDTIFLVTPESPPHFPSGVLWQRIWCATDAKEMLAAATLATGQPTETRVVGTAMDMDLPGVQLRLVTNRPGHPDRLFVDIRHGGHRVLLVPESAQGEQLRALASAETTDLVALLPGKRVAQFREKTGLRETRFLMVGEPSTETRAPGWLLEEGRRRLFLWDDNGVRPLGGARDIDS